MLKIFGIANFSNSAALKENHLITSIKAKQITYYVGCTLQGKKWTETFFLPWKHQKMD